MQEFDLILRNACVNGAYFCDIGIKHEVITALGVDLVATENTQVVDCEYAVVTPGGVDAHVHLSQDRSPRAREAGYVSADTGESSVFEPYTTKC
jgi:dihydropyrimidinase